MILEINRRRGIHMLCFRV